MVIYRAEVKGSGEFLPITDCMFIRYISDAITSKLPIPKLITEWWGDKETLYVRSYRHLLVILRLMVK